MLCCIQDSIDPAASNVIHHHHNVYDKKCEVGRENENHCVLTICQRHKIGLTEKQQAVTLRYSTPKTTAVAMYYCKFPKGCYRIL
jgi:hypothetical protein